MKIKDEITKDYRLSEIGHGKTEVQFCYLNPKTGQMITPWCRCKDYFNDMFWSNKTNKPVDICGFHWKPNQDNGVLSEKKMVIALRLRDRDNKSDIKTVSAKHMTSLKGFLNKFETKLKFTLSTIEKCEDDKNIIIKSSMKWSEIPYVLSAYFMFLRIGLNYDLKKSPISFLSNASSSDFISPHDESYYRSTKAKVEDLYKGIIDKNQKYEKYNQDDIHDCSGIVGYTEYKPDSKTK